MNLPPLAFGHTVAAPESNEIRASERMAQIVPSMKLAPAAKTTNFLTKVATFAIGDMRLLAHAATPCTMEVSESKGWHLIAPYIGTASLSCERKAYELRSGVSALLMPNMQRSTERAPSSVVIASIDMNRLQQTISVMGGHAGEIVELADQPATLHLDRSRGLFPSFLQICGMINASYQTTGLSEKLGIDDMIYRWMAAAMGDTSPPEIDETRISASSSLDMVCDLIRSSHDRPLTLTEMEDVSGLSARGLQYAFKARFDCAPMQWQRHERMLLMQQLLMNLNPDQTITSVAYSMGFSSSAAFATLYKKHFGETPSETVRRYR